MTEIDEARARLFQRVKVAVAAYNAGESSDEIDYFASNCYLDMNELREILQYAPEEKQWLGKSLKQLHAETIAARHKANR